MLFFSRSCSVQVQGSQALRGTCGEQLQMDDAGVSRQANHRGGGWGRCCPLAAISRTGSEDGGANRAVNTFETNACLAAYISNDSAHSDG